MANTSRNISRACGKANNKSRWNPSGCIIKGQHVELKSITSRNSVGSWYVAIASRDSEESRCVDITSRNSNIKESRCVASPPAYKKESRIYSIDQLLRASGSYRRSPTNCRCRQHCWYRYDEQTLFLTAKYLGILNLNSLAPQWYAKFLPEPYIHI